MPNLNDLAPGQVWTYSDAVSPTSRVVIGRVDDFGDGIQVVSIAVTDVPIPTVDASRQTIGHMPFAPDGILPSLIRLEEDGAISDGFEDGYATWRSAWDEGQAGAFTLSVADAVDAIAQTAGSASAGPQS
ncbi:hypothetical protein [Aureimonas sp. ME7]|uniref:hypothetical protein n=1 Tax=Aureimonas sp. ME7 TaxID=2744252 RepID=UPI0015F64902|nr:hypothetical protein [Aureimonas sp. ME7]